MRVVVETRAIVARFAGERPCVQMDEWDAPGYARQRAELWRDALQAPLAVRGTRLQVVIDADVDVDAEAAGACSTQRIGGDTITVQAPEPDAEALRQFVAEAARAVAADTGGWRRFLLPAWFERHRAWRHEVGSPIQH
ncbi:MAG: hypothetical protein KGL78_11745 [Burkholderiales bacterium]|nr:hypothetical protein [Burkholderiales bacterium]